MPNFSLTENEIKTKDIEYVSKFVHETLIQINACGNGKWQFFGQMNGKLHILP